MTPMLKPMLLTVPEACRVLGGLSRAQLYRYLVAGELQCVHFGRLIKIKTSSIEAFIERQSEAEELYPRLRADLERIVRES